MSFVRNVYCISQTPSKDSCFKNVKIQASLLQQRLAFTLPTSDHTEPSMCILMEVTESCCKNKKERFIGSDKDN